MVIELMIMLAFCMTWGLLPRPILVMLLYSSGGIVLRNVHSFPGNTQLDVFVWANFIFKVLLFPSDL